MEPSNTTPSREELYKVRFAERWELLKPVLERLYFDEKLKLPEIISLMKSTYNFQSTNSTKNGAGRRVFPPQRRKLS
jgi:hypothetical protein